MDFRYLIQTSLALALCSCYMAFAQWGGAEVTVRIAGRDTIALPFFQQDVDLGYSKEMV